MKKRKKYTDKHLAFLREGYKRLPVRDLTPAFNKRFRLDKNACQIRAALKNHGITCGRKPGERMMPCRLYTPRQATFLKDNYAGRSVAALTKLFNKRFDICRTQQQIKTFVHNRHITNGRTGWFEKGHVPFNKGTKGLMKRNRTTFKRGNKPANTRSLGSERVDSRDGFILIKIREKNPYTGAATRFKHKHVHVWEKAHRKKVPPGMVVAFRDGNKRNCAPGNLMLLSRAELLRLNQKGYAEMPSELKPSVLALARLEVKTFSLLKR